RPVPRSLPTRRSSDLRARNCGRSLAPVRDRLRRAVRRRARAGRGWCFPNDLPALLPRPAACRNRPGPQNSSIACETPGPYLATIPIARTFTHASRAGFDSPLAPAYIARLTTARSSGGEQRRGSLPDDDREGLRVRPFLPRLADGAPGDRCLARYHVRP